MSMGRPRSKAVATIGTPFRRREDYRFLTGGGTYTDDINRPGQLYAYILRSPHAHARVAGIDTSAAQRAPGIVAVYAGKDMAADGVGGLPCGWQIHSKDGSPMAEPPHPVLAVDRVRYVGDPVAVVVAESLARRAMPPNSSMSIMPRSLPPSTRPRRCRRARHRSTPRRRAIFATTGTSATLPLSKPPVPRPRGSSS